MKQLCLFRKYPQLSEPIVSDIRIVNGKGEYAASAYELSFELAEVSHVEYK
jgi:hypothetical protein